MEQKQASLKCSVETLLKPLRIIAKCLAILPISKEGHRVHATIVILFYISTYAFTAYGKFNYMHGVLLNTVFVLDITSDFILASSLITTIILINVLRADKEQQFLNKLADVDNEFSRLGKDVICYKKRVYIELICTQVVFAIYYTYYCWMWIESLGLAKFKFFFVRDIQAYHLLILSLILRNYALAIKYRSACLNAVLTDVSLLNVPGVFLRSGEKDSISKFTNIERVRKIYTKLCVICGDYNELFGECFVILYINIVLNLLGPANLAFVYGSGENDIDGAKFGTSLIILCMVWCSLPMINSWAIFSGCDQCAGELAKTSVVCYTTVQTLSNGGKEGMLKSELRELAQEASNTKPEISAAGFFVVNYTVLFSLVGSVTAYLIVLIQFNK